MCMLPKERDTLSLLWRAGFMEEDSTGMLSVPWASCQKLSMQVGFVGQGVLMELWVMLRSHVEHCPLPLTPN